jgi:hypothetical protein
MISTFPTKELIRWLREWAAKNGVDPSNLSCSGEPDFRRFDVFTKDKSCLVQLEQDVRAALPFLVLEVKEGEPWRAMAWRVGKQLAEERKTRCPTDYDHLLRRRRK